MSDVETILQATRAVFMTGLGLTNEQVLVAESGSTRKVLPYLTVKVITPGGDAGIALDWVTNGLSVGDNPTITPRGVRRATVSINGFGRGAVDWLEVFQDLVRQNPDVKAELKTAGIAYRSIGAITDITELVDVGFEYRTNLTAIVSFEHVGTTIEQTGLQQVKVDFTGNSPVGPSPVTMSETIDPDNPPC